MGLIGRSFVLSAGFSLSPKLGLTRASISNFCFIVAKSDEEHTLRGKDPETNSCSLINLKVFSVLRLEWYLEGGGGRERKERGGPSTRKRDVTIATAVAPQRFLSDLDILILWLSFLKRRLLYVPSDFRDQRDQRFNERPRC